MGLVRQNEDPHTARSCATRECRNDVPTPRSRYCAPCAKKRLRRQNREAQQRRRARSRQQYRKTGSAYLDAYAALYAITTEIAERGGAGTITPSQTTRLVEAATRAVRAMGHDLKDEATRQNRVPRTFRGDPTAPK